MVERSSRAARSGARGDVRPEGSEPAGWVTWRGPEGTRGLRCCECGAVVALETACAGLEAHAASVSHGLHARTNELARLGGVALEQLPVGLLTADERQILRFALSGPEWRALASASELLDLAQREREAGDDEGARLLELVGQAVDICARFALPLYVALERVRGVVR
jgi:hypothetical protein